MIGGRFRVAVLLGGLLLVAGCSGSGSDPEPSETPATSETSTPVGTVSAEPEIEVPVAPAAEKTAKGAEEFVRYFWEVHNYAYATLNTDEFRMLSEPACTFCTETLSDLDKIRSRGSTISGYEVTVDLAVAPPGKINSRVVVTSLISQGAGAEMRPDGSQEALPAVPKTRSSVALQWSTAQWTIHDVSIDDYEEAS